MGETERRITLKRVHPNPLFQEWLEELYEEAKEKHSKLENMLKEALDSLSKYPLPLESGSECMILKGFQKKLCLHLDKRLEAYNYNLELEKHLKPNTSQSITSTTSSSSFNSKEAVIDFVNENNNNINIDNYSNNMVSISTAETNPSGINNRKPRGSKYKPAYRSGGFAILIALLENPSLSKNDLIERAQKHSEESFTRRKPNSYYTAWSNMARLVDKGLVLLSKSKKVQYSLTDQGKTLAEELARENVSRVSVNDIIFNKALSPGTSANNPVKIPVPNTVSSTSHNVNELYIEIAAGTFDIILLIDKNETGGLSKKNDPTVAQFQKYPDLKHEYRSLKVGDFTWIARSKQDSSQELVLPYVIERKRMDDLAASIKDGRYHEQKFRLKKCGLQNVIYLIENYGSNKFVGLPVQNLMQAMANTRAQDGFKVHTTDSLTNTARFLAILTRRLTIRYTNKHLKGCNRDPNQEDVLMTYDYFKKSTAKSKPLTVKETFIKLLLQLKGLSVEKAVAITSKYSTPHSLISSYMKCSQSEGEFLLSDIKFGKNDRKIGPSLSKSIYKVFSTSQ